MAILNARHALTVIGLAGLMTGCSATLHTRSVQSADTYDLWSARMDRMPFVYHLADGRTDIVDERGHAWPGMQGAPDARAAERVEVYVGHVGGASGSLCGAPSTADASAASDETDVVSALCEHARTVVSFSDRVRPRVLAERGEYTARVRHLLLDGIWESVAQEPDPLPQ